MKHAITIIAVVGCIGMASTSVASVEFTGLGFLVGGLSSSAYGVSADGSFVVGYSSTANRFENEAFRWTSGGGMVGLGDLAGGSFKSYASGASADGSVVVGNSASANGDKEAFRWTSGGMIGLGDLPGGSFQSIASGVSDDGSAVVGYSSSYGGAEAFRWTSVGMLGLGYLALPAPFSSSSSHAAAVSADGSVVVGGSSTAYEYETEPFRWTLGGGMVGLGHLNGGSGSYHESTAYDVSADGSIVVGYSASANGRQAFRWTSGGGMVGLGDLVGGGFKSAAYGTSADGSVVVGSSISTNGTEAFVWDEVEGMQSLKTVLEDSGIDMTGWTLERASGISDDGKTIVGWGYYNGISEGFVAVLESENPILPGDIGVASPTGSISDGGSAGYGNQAVGVEKALIFTISNEAIADTTSLTDFNITKDGADAPAFALGDIDSTSLSNGESTTFRVTYTPPSVGSHSASIHIASNDEDESPFDITLTGTGLANADSDPGSDAWEAANGFDPNTSGDVMTLDSDGDGSPDIMEIYQGTERYAGGGAALLAMESMALSGDKNGFMDVYATSNGILKVYFRRSTTQSVVNAQSVWTPDLAGDGWKYSGESYSGAVVTITETVVSNGPSFEIIEAVSEVTTGDSDTLFFTLELTPNE